MRPFDRSVTTREERLTAGVTEVADEVNEALQEVVRSSKSAPS